MIFVLSVTLNDCEACTIGARRPLQRNFSMLSPELHCRTAGGWWCRRRRFPRAPPALTWSWRHTRPGAPWAPCADGLRGRRCGQSATKSRRWQQATLWSQLPLKTCLFRRKLDTVVDLTGINSLREKHLCLGVSSKCGLQHTYICNLSYYDMHGSKSSWGMKRTVLRTYIDNISKMIRIMLKSPCLPHN